LPTFDGTTFGLSEGGKSRLLGSGYLTITITTTATATNHGINNPEVPTNR